MYFQSQDKSECCGCGTCADICSKKAIEMQPDAHGFRYPIIDKDLCIGCCLCEKSCIFSDEAKHSSFNVRYFAVCSKDSRSVLQSSSGGMFTLLSNEIFARKGIVYGAAYGENFRIEHQKAENPDDAAAFRTSKYVQSDITHIFESVKNDLLEGNTVLFTGTPCQVAGLNAFLKFCHVNTTALYTCDLICHGVSSPLVFADYLECLKKYVPHENSITAINMRHKNNRDAKTNFSVFIKPKKLLHEADSYSYYRLYYNRIITRPSCFNCKFTSYSRNGDLTIGDFWNNKKGEIAFDTTLGVNEVLINSQKGLELFESIKERAYYQEVTREKAWQPHLEYPTQKPENYDKFWEEYLASADREQVMRKYLKVSPLFKVINFATPILRKTGLYTICGKLYKKVFVKKK